MLKIDRGNLVAAHTAAKADVIEKLQHLAEPCKHPIEQRYHSLNDAAQRFYCCECKTMVIQNA